MSQDAVQRLERRLEALEARAAAGELMAGYAFGFDSRDVERFTAIWAPDASLHLGAFGELKGIDAIRGAYDTVLGRTRETRHWITDVTAELAGADTATGGSHAICFMVSAAGDELFVSADYETTYELRAGRWSISRCRVITHWNKKVDLETQS